jgi:NADPH-dependent 2,4-dienoyl-CoA reductase/sulfur reductase-like enzyme
VSGKTLKGENFRLFYDKLLIATGVSLIIPDLPDFDLPGVMGLKYLGDGRRIKRFIIDRDVKRVAMVGMGSIALEMCEAPRTRGVEVDMVKPHPALLPRINEKLSAIVKDEIEVNGVKLQGISKNGCLESIRPSGGSCRPECKR